MRTSGAAAAAAALALGLVVAPATPASAASAVVTDPAGDAGGPKRLDVVRVKLVNDDDRVVVRVAFAAETKGDLVVSVDPRGKRGVRLVAERDADGDVVGHVVPGAFTDSSLGDEPAACAGYRVRWASDVARLVMPSTCLQDGDYGAVRFAVLTENGGDSDWAPEGPDGDLRSSAWIARG